LLIRLFFTVLLIFVFVIINFLCVYTKITKYEKMLIKQVTAVSMWWDAYVILLQIFHKVCLSRIIKIGQ